MTELAQYREARAKAAETPVRRALRFLLQPAALGLLLALLVAGLLGNWFYRQASAGLAAEQHSRVAIVEGSALADFVSGRLAEAPDDAAALQASLQDWVERSPDDDAIRVVRLGGARLLASTFPTERAGELPRRSPRKRSGCSTSVRSCAPRRTPTGPRVCSASGSST